MAVKIKKGKLFKEAAKLQRVKELKEYGPFDQERAFITTLIDGGDFTYAMASRVDETWFSDDDNRKYFRWLRDQFDKYGKLPSPGRFEAHFKFFTGLATHDSLEELLGAMREKKVFQETKLIMQAAQDRMKDDPAGAVEGLSTKLMTMQANLSPNIFANVGDYVAEQKKQYEEAEKAGGITGYHWPWEILNEFTRGVLPGYYVFYGDQGVQKTFLLMFLALWFCKLAGGVGLFTLEMPPDQIRTRFAAQAAQLDYGKVSRGKLDAKQKKRFFRCLDEIGDYNLFLGDLEESGNLGLQELRARILQNKKIKVWMIDGLGMLAEDQSWESTLKVQVRLSKMAAKLGVVIIAMHHTNGEEVKSEDQNNAKDVAGGKSVAKYASGLFRLRRNEQHREDEETQVETVKMRDGEDKIIFTMHAKPGVSYDQKCVLKRPRPKEDDDDDGPSDRDKL